MAAPEIPPAATDIATLRRGLEDRSVQPIVDDLSVDDLDRLGWSGNQLHIASMADALRRVQAGEVEYLVARAPDRGPIAKAGIDYTARHGTGTIWQVATHPKLEGLGLCRLLFAEAERRIAARGLHVARLGVERGNGRARRLYDFLGYVKVGEEPDSWPTLDDTGKEFTYHTVCELMEKPLT